MNLVISWFAFAYMYGNSQIIFGVTSHISGIKLKIDQYKAAQNFHDVVIKMGAFGGCSWKPLRLFGTWKGLQIVEKVYHALYPKMKDRHFEALTCQSGKFLTSKLLEESFGIVQLLFAKERERERERQRER